jgi:uncharacterized protein (TIGR02118 family)
MFRVIFEIYRHPDLTREQFAARWTEHGPLVSRFPGLRSYSQCLVLGSERLQGTEADGISILDFDSEADYRRADSSAEIQAAHDDAATFVSAVAAYYVEPRQVS